MRSDFIEMFQRWKNFEAGVVAELQSLRTIVQNDPPPGGYTKADIEAWTERAEVAWQKIESHFQRRVEETWATTMAPAPPPAGFDD